MTELTLFATPPNSWLERQLCRIVGAKTFHWGVIVCQVGDDWITSESISKGTALSRLHGRYAFFYKVKFAYASLGRLIDIHSEHGELPYDWQVNIRAAVWWLFKHYLGKVLPVLKDRPVNCQEWVCLVASELGVKLIPDGEYPVCTNLEHSPMLELVDEVN